MKVIAAVTATAALAGCGRAPISSCADDLRGEYATAGDETWAILDEGSTLEAYPLFADVATAPPAADANVEIAPRVIDVHRTASAGGELAGRVRRRYGLRGEFCDATAPFHVTRCERDRLEVVRGDPQPPLAFSPCAPARAGDSRVETWTRTR